MWFTVLKAIAARSIFAIHAFVAVWRVVDIRGGDPIYWLFASTIGLLVIEGFVSICLRSGREMKWFCPSVFLYLCCIIPPTWMMELDLVYVRRQLAISSSTSVNTTMIHRREKLSQIPGLELTIDLALPAEMWAKLLEQFLLVNLVLGRWLLPKGGLTRGQLSQLLLVYIGMAADIVELFEAFKEDIVNTNLELTCAVLALWSWSLMQFTLVLTATKARKPRLGLDSSVNKEYKSTSVGEQTCCSPLKRFCAMDTWAIMTTIIFQDGPFLCLRLLLIIKYNVIYRMSVLSIESRKVKANRSLHQLLPEEPEVPQTEMSEASRDMYCATEHQREPPVVVVHDKPPQWSRYSPVTDENYDRKNLSCHKLKKKKSSKKKKSAMPGHDTENCSDMYQGDERDSVFLSYSQNKNAPWSDISFTLSSSHKRIQQQQRPAITNIDSSCESDSEQINRRLNRSIKNLSNAHSRDGNSQENVPLLTV